jgi:hypothetical protein
LESGPFKATRTDGTPCFQCQVASFPSVLLILTFIASVFTRDWVSVLCRFVLMWFVPEMLFWWTTVHPVDSKGFRMVWFDLEMISKCELELDFQSLSIEFNQLWFERFNAFQNVLMEICGRITQRQRMWSSSKSLMFIRHWRQIRTQMQQGHEAQSDINIRFLDNWRRFCPIPQPEGDECLFAISQMRMLTAQTGGKK